MIESFWSALAGGSLVTLVFGSWLRYFFGPYISQKAQNIATHEDIHKLIDQVRETEQVKARINDTVWDRQARWNEKRDMYFRVLKGIGRLINDQQDQQSHEELRSQFGVMPELRKDVDESVGRLERTMDKWFRVVDVAPLFVSDEASSIIEAVFPAIRPSPLAPESCIAVCNANIAHLQRCRADLWKVAKADLGFEKTKTASGD